MRQQVLPSFSFNNVDLMMMSLTESKTDRSYKNASKRSWWEVVCVLFLNQLYRRTENKKTLQTPRDPTIDLIATNPLSSSSSPLTTFATQTSFLCHVFSLSRTAKNPALMLFLLYHNYDVKMLTNWGKILRRVQHELFLLLPDFQVFFCGSKIINSFFFLQRRASVDEEKDFVM